MAIGPKKSSTSHVRLPLNQATIPAARRESGRPAGRLITSTNVILTELNRVVTGTLKAVFGRRERSGIARFSKDIREERRHEMTTDGEGPTSGRVGSDACPAHPWAWRPEGGGLGILAVPSPSPFRA